MLESAHERTNEHADIISMILTDSKTVIARIIKYGFFGELSRLNHDNYFLRNLCFSAMIQNHFMGRDILFWVLNKFNIV